MLSLLGMAIMNSPCFAALTSSMVSFVLNPGSQECIYEEAFFTNDKIFMHYTIQEGDDSDLDVRIYGPDMAEIERIDKANERVLLRATSPGKYCACFRLPRGKSQRAVSFTSLKQSDESVQSWQHRGVNAAKSRSIEDMEASLLSITNGLQEIRNEQVYLSGRERIQRETTDSTNRKFILWGLIEIIIILCISSMQIRLLKKCFENKRSV